MKQQSKLQKLTVPELSKAAVTGEYRGGKVEVIKYTDKKGNAATFAKIVHRIEIGEESVIVNESTDGLSGDELAKYVSPIAKGARVAVLVSPARKFGQASFEGYCVPVV